MGCVSSEPRRRLSPDDRRAELIALGARIFGSLPYDEVRIDEIAEKAGVSRALMYHYFPDKRAFFAAIVRAEGERLFEATNALSEPGLTPFERLRAGVLAYLRYDERHPHGAWAAYVGVGRSDPILRGIEDLDNDRQAERIMAEIASATSAKLGKNLRRDLRATVYSWLAFTVEFCRQRVIDPSLDAERIADTCAHALLDAIARIPDLPTDLADAVAMRPERPVTPAAPGARRSRRSTSAARPTAASAVSGSRTSSS
jgi:AcrR family transcriptional regulator